MSTEQAGQTPQPLIPGHRKLSDFVQPRKVQLQETQEIAAVPRMKLPTINMSTGESVVPWVMTWSGKGKTAFIPTCRREQTPYTPLPDMFSDIETIHLPTIQPLKTELQTPPGINTFVATEERGVGLEEHSPKKQARRSIWKYIRVIFSRFSMKIRRIFFPKASQLPTHFQ